jgi:hypothetical protein
MIYTSFAAAYKALNIPFNPDLAIDNISNIHSLKIIDRSDSYNEVLQGGRIIKFLGNGRLLKPGHPASNQQWLSQEPFRKIWINSTTIPIFRKNTMGKVLFLGNYQIKDIIKKMGFEGFSFFHVILHRIDAHPVVNLNIYKSYINPISATSPHFLAESAKQQRLKEE